MPDYALGRVPNPPDARDLDYSMAAFIAENPRTIPTTKIWTPPDNVLSQAEIGACVGFAGAAWLECEPVVQQVTSRTGFHLYYQCKEIDGYPGEGTYSRTLMEVLTRDGAAGSYHWATSMADFDDWLLSQGPIMIGIPWYASMFNPNADGTVNITGIPIGGHEILVYGKRPDGLYAIRNSWTAQWGVNGDFYLTGAQMQRLVFNEGGDAVAAVQIGNIPNPYEVTTCDPWFFIYHGGLIMGFAVKDVFAPMIVGVQAMQLPAGNYLSWFRAAPQLANLVVIKNGDVVCVSGPVGTQVFV